MNKLNKSEIGLGEVRNRVAPSMEEYEMIVNKLSELVSNEEVTGDISTLDNDPRVTTFINPSNSLESYIIDLDKVSKVKIRVDEDNKRIVLVGGLQGKPIIFEFINTASHDISWNNLRVSGGLSPGLSIVPYVPPTLTPGTGSGSGSGQGPVLTPGTGSGSGPTLTPGQDQSPEEGETCNCNCDCNCDCTDQCTGNESGQGPTLTPGQTPEEEINNTPSVARTIYEIIRLGDNYYLTNDIYEI